MPDKLREKRLSEEQKALLINDLATGTDSQKTLAIKYGVTDGAVTRFKHAHQHEIEERLTKSLAHITGENVKNAEWRFREYERDLAKLDGKRSPEFVRVRGQLLHQMAEEMGQLPPRMQIQIMPVTHIIRGIDIDEALPILDSTAEYALDSSVSNSESLKALPGTFTTPNDLSTLESVTEP